MTIKKQTMLKAVLISFVVLTALFASAWIFISNQLSRLDNYKDSITKAVGTALNRDVAYEKGKATLTIHAGLALQFTGVVIREKERSGDLLSVQTAFFRVDSLPLLRNRIVLREVILDQPRLSLRRDRHGLLNIADLLAKERKPGMDLEFRKLTIEKGLVTFFDQGAGEQELVTSLTNLSCRIDKPRWGKKAPFRITAAVHEGGSRGEIALAGTFSRAPYEKPLADSYIDASIRLKGMDILHYGPYLKTRLPFQQLAGHLDVETTFSGTIASFKAEGNIAVKDARLQYPEFFNSVLQPQSVHVKYALTRNGNYLKVSIAHAALDSFTAAGHFSIKDMDKSDPLLEATAVTSAFSLREIQPYIPRLIIPRNIGIFIDDHIKDGNFRLIEGKLNGRKSQIANIGKPENAGVLFLQAEVNKGVFVVNKTTPVFQDVSGRLEFKNRQLLLKAMTGRFGASPCRLEGGISDFALPAPAVYTANMAIQPARAEILWLAGKEKFRALSFHGDSTLLLSGKGSADNYHISARWDLTNAGYAYPKVLEKQPGRANGLTAEINLKEKAVFVSSFNYDLVPLQVSGSGIYRFAGGKPLSLTVQSKEFDIRDVISVLPVLQRYEPAGKCLLNFAGRGNLDDPRSFRWQGNISLANVSWKPPDGIQAIKGLTGSIILRGTGMETSLFNVRIGDSGLQAKCRINDFRRPQAVCQFNAAAVAAADLGLQSPEGAIIFQDVKGQAVLEDKNIRMDRLTFQQGKSFYKLSFNISDFSGPQIQLALHSPYINFTDVASLLTLKAPLRKNKKNDASSRVALEATLHADLFVFQGIDFKNLAVGLKYTGDVLNFKVREAGFFDGKIRGKGKVDIFSDGRNRYEANFSVERASLENIQNFLDIEDRLVTGSLSLTGNVTATGRNLDDLRKTAAGAFQVRAEKGVLKKFSVLAKIFSLLNVFQLAKLQLPDMAKGGMPYKTITGGLLLKNSVFFSEDFFVDSDAMQISALGKVDVHKQEVDNVVGVHPLNTVDKIVGKIPVAGWLITDERGHLITVHFKVDGKWDDPQVTPMPVQSMAQGTLDIFRRLFRLPEKLVTETGEVVLGH